VGSPQEPDAENEKDEFEEFDDRSQQSNRGSNESETDFLLLELQEKAAASKDQTTNQINEFTDKCEPREKKS
jgi:hypothetical protein